MWRFCICPRWRETNRNRKTRRSSGVKIGGSWRSVAASYESKSGTKDGRFSQTDYTVLWQFRRSLRDRESSTPQCKQTHRTLSAWDQREYKTARWNQPRLPQAKIWRIRWRSNYPSRKVNTSYWGWLVQWPHHVFVRRGCWMCLTWLMSLPSHLINYLPRVEFTGTTKNSKQSFYWEQMRKD